ncbi:MAG: hypothetical protein ABUL58_00615 [Steroidobacter sp.]
MKNRSALFSAMIITIFHGNVVMGADDAFAKDLKATIALQGLPCSEVTEAKRNADSDYNVACKDGNRYHVYVNDKGRVIVQKL